MWGNSTGWTISAIIVVIFCGAIFFVEKTGMTPSDMTPKFAAQAGNMQPISLPTAPETIVPMNESCDAAPAYRQVIREYRDHSFEYDNPRAAQAALLKSAIADRLVEATHCRNVTIFTANPEEVINFDREKTPVKALQQIGDITAIHALLLQKKGDLANSQKYAEAAFALGAKLYHERIVYDELEAGLGLMGSASHVLAIIATARGDKARAQQINQFDEARKNYAGRDGPLDDFRVITRNIDGNLSATRAGDVFYLAEKSPERMWRVEACFQLARIHRNVGEDGHASDQRHAQKLLRQLADNDPDPIVRLAAKKARDITDAEYRKQ